MKTTRHNLPTHIAKKIICLMLCLAAASIIGCQPGPVVYESHWMDSKYTMDPSLTSANYLVSTRIEKPTDEQLNTPVIICSHGFSASTFEWIEFKQYIQKKRLLSTKKNPGLPFISLVLLGGHGRHLDAFKNSTWKDWGQPILDEYYALKSKGYKQVSIATTSTSGALLLNYLANHEFDIVDPPHSIFFIDPIVVAGNPLLPLAKDIGPSLGHLPADEQATLNKKKNWYNNIPWQPLAQLFDLLEIVRMQLGKKSIVLPRGTKAYVYKSDKDTVADPMSALMIYKGLKTYENKPIHLTFYDTDLHVMTQLLARESVSEKQASHQKEIFDDMIRNAKK